MYKNKSISGRNNICGIKIRELRSRMNDVSQKRLADMLQLLGHKPLSALNPLDRVLIKVQTEKLKHIRQSFL